MHKTQQPLKTFKLTRTKGRLFKAGLLITTALGALGALFYPEIAQAVKIEDQLETVNTLTTGKIKTIGVTGATILGFIWAIFKGNPKLAGVIVALGVGMGFYLNWVAGGMKLS